MCSNLIIILHILILSINQIMYSFTYKISLGMVLIRLFLNEIILIILIKVKLKIMEKKLFAIECGNVILVVRPNGDTVIVTEATELVLDNAVMEQIVRNSGTYKSFVATKDEIVANLEEDNTNLQIKVRELKKELETIKADRDKLQENLVNATVGAEPMVKGRVVNQKSSYLYDIDGSFLADCGTDKRAKRVQYLLQEGKVSLDVVMEIFGNTGRKKSRVADIPASGEK
jgi:chaperonin cofactor prefoldin